MTGEIPPTYELQEASRSYGESSTLVLALDALNLTIKRGEFVAVFGTSGRGDGAVRRLRALIATAPVALALMLAACGGGSSPPPSN